MFWLVGDNTCTNQMQLPVLPTYDLELEDAVVLLTIRLPTVQTLLQDTDEISDSGTSIASQTNTLPKDIEFTQNVGQLNNGSYSKSKMVNYNHNSVAAFF